MLSEVLGFVLHTTRGGRDGGRSKKKLPYGAGDLSFPLDSF